MENLRRQMASDKNLYPDAISVGSSDSSSAPPRPPVGRGSHRSIITISDSDSDNDNVHPLKQRIPSGQKPQPPPWEKPAKPIHIPSNTDLSRPKATALEIDGEEGAINIDGQVNLNDHWEVPKTASEVDKELKELFSGTSVDHKVEFDEEDTIVEGFSSDFRLLHHQVQARHWMKEREEGNKHGGILADDMGLGKTIQTLVRIVEGKPRRSDREKGYGPGTLVIAPTSLATQWEEEIKRMTSLKVLLHTGANRTNDPEVLLKYHVVITSYGTVASEHNDSAKKKKVLNALFKVKWWRIVLDEAHTIKNKATKGAKACFDLQANHRWCLTGTPIQNKVEEFFSLIAFLRVKPLNDWASFKEKIVDPLKRGRTKAPMKRLHAVLKFVMLRRSKDDTVNGKKILDLPPKIIEVVHCDFSPAERRFYRSIEAKMSNELDKLANSDDQRSYMHMLTLLLRARQACDHPALVMGDWKQDEDAVINRPENNSQEEEDDGADLAKALDTLNLSAASKCQICFKQLESPTDTHCEVCLKLSQKVIDTSESDSAKIRKVVELVDEIEDRSQQTEKIIIFSQFTSMLALIRKVLEEKGTKFVQYDGSMNQKQRQSVLTTVKENPKVRVILMSFKAGGVGLNLTACNNVILVDLWWNPALEDQAFGRAHRIGQKKQVNVWKLTIEDTVEDRILMLQEKKRELAESALSGEALSKMATLGRDELLALFKRNPHEDDEDEDED